MENYVDIHSGFNYYSRIKTLIELLFFGFIIVF